MKAYITPHQIPCLYLYNRSTDTSIIKAKAYIGDILELVDPTDISKIDISNAWIEVVLGSSTAWVKADQVSLAQPVTSLVWKEGHALVGLHGPTEPWADRWNDSLYQMITTAKIEAVKLLASRELLAFGEGKVTEIVARLHQAGVKVIIARLFAKFNSPKTPQEFVNEVGQAYQVLYNHGVRYFEVHNEPNLNMPDSPEGMYINWKNGKEFSQFFLEVLHLLKSYPYELPEAQLGFPGLSPVGFSDTLHYYARDQFLLEADEAIKRSDFICMHTYWDSANMTYRDSLKSIQKMCNDYPDKLIIVSEFANTDRFTYKTIKGQEYVKFYQEAANLPSNLGALIAYTSTSAGDYNDQVWLGSSIPSLVGNRS